MPAPQLCPNCGLYSLPQAAECDCGFDFVRGVQPPGAISTPDPVRASFWATLIALPVWLAGAVAVSPEVSATGVVFYGLLLLVLWPITAYAASRVLAPFVARMVRPLRSLLFEIVTLTATFGLAAVVIYSRIPSDAEAMTAGALFSLTLALALGPSIYVGCLAYLLAADTRKRRNAG